MNWNTNLNPALFLLVFLPSAHFILPSIFTANGNRRIIENRAEYSIFGPNTDEVDDLLDCFSVGYLECGAELVQQDNTYGSSNITTFQIGDQVWGDNTGPELLYYFDIYYSEEVTITLDNFAASQNFELILLKDCDETTGIAASTNAVGMAEQIKRTLEPGRYFVLVEGKNGTTGTFDLSAQWNCRKNVETGPLTIQCGQTLEGSTVGFSNDLTIQDYEDCIEFTFGENYGYKDALYRFDLLEPQFLQIELEILTELSQLEFFLLESTYPPGQPNTPTVGSCIARSVYDGNSRESLSIDLEPGTYWVSIDAALIGFWVGAFPPNEGVFKLSMNCTAFPSPCDLNGEFIASGNTILNKLTTEINTLPFIGIDCIADNYELSAYLKGHVFTYYSETSALTSIELESDDINTNAYVFNCSISNRNQSCIASTDGISKKISFPAEANTYYQVVVLKPQNEYKYFNISIPTPDGPCSNDVPQSFQQFDIIEGSLEGEGNDFDVTKSSFFQHCSANDIPYDGEDRVFQLDFPSTPDTDIASNIGDGSVVDAGSNSIYLESESAMGLFLFNYQCGQQYCLAQIELPEGGGRDSIFIDGYIDKPGTYYLVLDKATAQGTADFTLRWDYGFFIVVCQADGEGDHTINFQNGILLNQEIVEPEDILYVDYLDKKYVGELLYETYTISQSNANTHDLLPVELFPQEPFSLDTMQPNSNQELLFQRCGFGDGEALAFKLLKKNGLILTLDPVYDTASIFTPPTHFQNGGVSLINGFEIRNPERLVKVDFEPFNFDMTAIPYKSSSFEAHIDVNGGWQIANLTGNDWLQVFDAQTGAEGPPLAQGNGPKKILVTVAENPEAEYRQLVFELVSEFGFARRVLARQLPNPCPLSAFDLTPEIANIACNGEATGTIIFSAENIQALNFKWDDGFEGAERNGLSAGGYTVTISDQSGCSSVKTMELSEPVDLLSVDLNVQPLLCADEVTAAFVTVTGGTPEYTVQWDDGTTGLSRANLVPGSYSLTVTDIENCTIVQSFKVESLPLQSVVIGGNRSFCDGDSTELSLSGFQSYRWNNGATMNSITVKTSGTYSVVAVDQNGCEIAASAQVTMYEKPEPMITGSQSICPGGSTVLSVDGYSSYQWSTGETGSFVQRAVPGPVSVTVTNVDGCVGTAAVNIVENEDLQPQISGDQEICEGETTTLDAGGFAGYQWSTGSITRLIPVTASGTYRVTVTDQQGCIGEADFSVTAYPLPMPSITGDTELCFGESSILSVTDDFTSYSWSDNSGGSTTEVSTNGTYRVIVTDDHGCRGEDEIVVFVNPEIILLPEVNAISCFGATDGKLLIGASGGTGALSYQWEPDLGDQADLTDLGPGVYTLTVTDENECATTDTWELMEPPSLDFVIESIRHETADSLGSIRVAVSGGVPPYTYYWSWPGGFRQTNMPNSGALAAGNYTVRIEDTNGCTVELTDVRIDRAVPTVPLKTLDQTLTVYPNPGKGIFQLEWQEVLSKDLKARVINIVGERIIEFTVPRSHRKTQINLENQAAGIYFLFIRDQNKYIARKIVIE